MDDILCFLKSELKREERMAHTMAEELRSVHENGAHVCGARGLIHTERHKCWDVHCVEYFRRQGFKPEQKKEKTDGTEKTGP